jgi:hypothetical protein
MHSISIWGLSQELATILIYQQAFRLLHLLLHRTSCVVRRRISFITLLSLCLSCVFLMIYIYSPPYTYKAKESLISSAQQSLSMMMTVSLFFFIVLRRFFSSSSSYRYKRNENVCVCVYICECGFSGWKRIECLFHLWEIFDSFSEREREKKKKKRRVM